jgi:bifunctional DNA-binding transcriptional regulator/antitoxin component of YhaV-PrlF toxin-antitoxin module
MVSNAEVERIAGGCRTISDKARALLKAGYSISETAMALNRSYQQIRQVVKGDEARKVRNAPARPAPAGEAAAYAIDPEAAIFRLSVDNAGRLALPAPLLNALGVEPGEAVIAEAKDGRISLSSAHLAMMQAQELIGRLLPAGGSLAESLLADRRREQARERGNG